MITFNIDSINLICETLKKCAPQQHSSFFFNDGNQNHQVSKFTALEEFFEVNGMDQAFTMGYKFTFVGGSELVIRIEGEELKVMPFSYKNDTKADYGISPKVSKYMF